MPVVRWQGPGAGEQVRLLTPAPQVLVIPRFAEFTLDVAGDDLDGEQVADAADLRVGLELAEIGEGHACPQLFQPLGCYLAVLHEIRVAVEDGFREKFPARDFDPEFTLEPEDDV